jgi:two-component system, sensor histidine kinase
MTTTPVARILLAEDTLISAVSVQGVFKQLNCSVDWVENGAAALDKLENHYDLFILDLGLPDISGLDIARLIRKYKVPISTTPIIILTAHGSEADREKTWEIGVDGFFLKPLYSEQCEEILQRFVLGMRSE